MARDKNGIDLDTQINPAGMRAVPEAFGLVEGLPTTMGIAPDWSDRVTQIDGNGKRWPIEDDPYLEEV